MILYLDHISNLALKCCHGLIHDVAQIEFGSIQINSRYLFNNIAWLGTGSWNGAKICAMSNEGKILNVCTAS